MSNNSKVSKKIKYESLLTMEPITDKIDSLLTKIELALRLLKNDSNTDKRP